MHADHTFPANHRPMIPARDLFQQHGLRCTQQREALFDALRRSTAHPTADELFSMVRNGDASLSRATVYNTLEALCNAGLARRLPGENGCCRYDADMSDHVHVRLIDSGEICDVPEALGQPLLRCLSRDAITQIEQAMGIEIKGMNIQFVGRRQ